MPWKASSVMEERLCFVARLLDGEAMTDVCRDFGISRKTGYKIFDRYKEHGLEALNDRSKRPICYANQLPAQIETLIVQLKAAKPHWGARKIRELLGSATRWRCSSSGQEHYPRGSRSPRFGQTRLLPAPSCARYAAVTRGGPQ
jgi:transposase